MYTGNSIVKVVVCMRRKMTPCTALGLAYIDPTAYAHGHRRNNVTRTRDGTELNTSTVPKHKEDQKARIGSKKLYHRPKAQNKMKFK
eukprot:3535553-Amphidinium_carterae.1